jgi:hypothetical protein
MSAGQLPDESDDEDALTEVAGALDAMTAPESAATLVDGASDGRGVEFDARPDVLGVVEQLANAPRSSAEKRAVERTARAYQPAPTPRDRVRGRRASSPGYIRPRRTREKVRR